MNTIVQTLWSQSFLQSAFLLLLTAILVPIVKAIIDYMSFKRQKRLESELAQQGKVIDYKTKLLDDIGKSSWEYWLLVKEPAYCKIRENEKEYEVAIQQYNQRAPILFGEIRTQLSRALRLATPKVYHNFHELFEKLIDVDRWHLELAEKGISKSGDWSQHFDFVYKNVAKETDNALALLAKDFGLIDIRALAYNPSPPLVF